MKTNKFKWFTAVAGTCLYFLLANLLPQGWGYGLGAFAVYAGLVYVWWQWAQGKL